MADYTQNPYTNNTIDQSPDHGAGMASRFLRTYTTMSGIDITAMRNRRPK